MALDHDPSDANDQGARATSATTAPISEANEVPEPAVAPAGQQGTD